MDRRKILGIFISAVVWPIAFIPPYALIGGIAYALGWPGSSALTAFALLTAASAATCVSVWVYLRVSQKR